MLILYDEIRDDYFCILTVCKIKVSEKDVFNQFLSNRRCILNLAKKNTWKQYTPLIANFLLLLDTIKFPIWQRMVLKKLGNNYQLFFRCLSFTPEDIQTARMNNNQDARNTKQELWDQWVIKSYALKKKWSRFLKVEPFFSLRIPDIHGAKFRWNLLILNVSKIWMILFWAMFHR